MQDFHYKDCCLDVYRTCSLHLVGITPLDERIAQIAQIAQIVQIALVAPIGGEVVYLLRSIHAPYTH